MKGLILAMLVGFLGTTAGANQFLADGYDMSMGKDCMKQAWTDAGPTADQNAEAEQVMKRVHEIYHNQKPEIDKAKKKMHAALMDHPISMRKAHHAALRMNKAVHPVKRALFGGSIKIVNLLSQDQRKLFNQSLHKCMADK